MNVNDSGLTREQIEEQYWPCACCRGKAGTANRQFKLNHRSIAKCRKCGATRQGADEILTKIKKKKP